MLWLRSRALFPCDHVTFPVSTLSPSAELQAEEGVCIFRCLREVCFFCMLLRVEVEGRQ